MCDIFFSISPGKCRRLSSRCVLRALNHKIIKRHLTIRGLRSDIVPHRLSRTWHNGLHWWGSHSKGSMQTGKKKKKKKKKNRLVFIISRSIMWEGHHFLSIKHWMIYHLWKGHKPMTFRQSLFTTADSRLRGVSAWISGTGNIKHRDKRASRALHDASSEERGRERGQ